MSAWPTSSIATLASSPWGTTSRPRPCSPTAIAIGPHLLDSRGRGGTCGARGAQDIALSMDALARLVDGAEAQAKLGNLVIQYRDWIEKQQERMPQSPHRRQETGQELLQRARVAAQRIDQGIDLLDDPQCLEAFRIANRAMATAARRRMGVMQNKPPESIEPKWRPFQLAFLLMNLKGIAEPASDDREVVDLLFFPTGGGKTEAYLGLAAFTLILRRLRNPGVSSAGLAVLMRYTLRLLTLDQLGRASTLICALELERQQDVETLGDWPVEIGLWVCHLSGTTSLPVARRPDGADPWPQSPYVPRYSTGTWRLDGRARTGSSIRGEFPL